MSRTEIIKKLQLYKAKPDVFQPLSPNELADLVTIVLSQVNEIEKQIKAGNDFATRDLTAAINKFIQEHRAENKVLEQTIKTSTASKEAQIDSKLAQIDVDVANALYNLKKRVESVKDGVVTEAEIQRAAQVALSMLELPDFELLVESAVQANGEAIRNALELLQGKERYQVEITDVKGLTDALQRLSVIKGSGTGGTSKPAVYQFIRDAIADGIITSGSGSGIVETIVAGTGISVDSTDPANPIVSATGGGGGAVDSVNSQTGVVVLDADDIDDTSTTNKFATAAELSKLAGIETGADVTDAANVAAAGAVMESDYTPAHSILVQQSGTGSPSIVTLGTGEFLGRKTGGGSAIEGLDAAEARTILNVADGATAYTDEQAQDAVGGMAANSTFVSLTYNDATPSLTPSLSATGTPDSTKFLRGDNTWAVPLGGSSGIIRSVTVTSGNTTAGSTGSTDYVYFVAGAHTISLPAASGNTNLYTIKNNHTANITIDTVGAETIDGTASIQIAREESVNIISNGTNFNIV